MALLAAKSSVILTINKYNSLTILMRSWLLNEKNKEEIVLFKNSPENKDENFKRKIYTI